MGRNHLELHESKRGTRCALAVGMTPMPTQQRIPWLAVLSVHDLRRLFRQVRAKGKAETPVVVAGRRVFQRPRAA